MGRACVRKGWRRRKVTPLRSAAGICRARGWGGHPRSTAAATRAAQWWPQSPTPRSRNGEEVDPGHTMEGKLRETAA
jgi:hypothetical protein